MSDNPMAFPQSNQLYGGMTLRDYFAGQALAALVADQLARADEELDILAVSAYEVADALLAARKAPAA